MMTKRFTVAALAIMVCIACIALTGCIKAPQDEDELPVEEWTVKEVKIINRGEDKVLQIVFDGVTEDLDKQISTDFDTMHPIAYRDLCSIPGVVYITQASFYNGVLSIYVSIEQPIDTSTLATFYTGWFYESDQDLYGITVFRKIRILTPSMQVVDQTN